MSISFLDLTPLCNAGLDTAIIPARKGWAGFPIAAKKLGGFPTGDGAFAGVPFRVTAPKGRGGNCLLLLAPADDVERRVEVHARAAALYLLHTTNRGDVGRTPVVYTFHYEDGSCADRLVTVGEDVGDWLFPADFANARIAWTGYHPDNEFQKCVYVCELANPRPKERIAAISVRRRDPFGEYMLLGMTLGTGKPFFAGARQGAATGLVPQVRLAGGDVLQLRDGRLCIEADLVGGNGRRIADASLKAQIAGRTYAFAQTAGGAVLCVPRRKGWRTYANAVRIVAARRGKFVAQRDAVFYCEGTPRSVKPPHGHRPPQFIVIAYDDCKKLTGVEAMLEIMENLKAKGARAPMTMYTSPCPAYSADLTKVCLLYQRMYDLGCEFCNHTLNHNPRGVNWYALPRAGQVHEIAGCRQWFRDHIHGLWHVYSQKSGGGGRAGFRDPRFSRDLLRSQQYEYDSNNVTARYETRIPHPDVQPWPYRLRDEWAIDVGLIDGNAPPVHRPITKGFFTDYSGKFDYSVAEGVAMMVANFDHRYRSRNRPPFIVNAYHDWGITPYYASHATEGAILEGFLTEVLVKHRNKYPDAHVVTFHQLIEYMKRDDLPAILAEGSGQGKDAR